MKNKIGFCKKILIFFISVFSIFGCFQPVIAKEETTLEATLFGEGIVELYDHEMFYTIQSNKPLKIKANSSKLYSLLIKSGQVETILLNNKKIQHVKEKIDFKVLDGCNKLEIYLKKETREANDDLERRKNIVRKLKLDNYVDSDFYVNDNYFEKFDDINYLLKKNAKEIVRPDYHFSEGRNPLQSENRVNVFNKSNPQITYFWTGYYATITHNGQSYTWQPAQWAIDGTVAYCGTARKPCPRIGDKIKPAVDQSNNEKLRKAVYYGLQNPGDKILAACNNDIDLAALVTNELISFAYSGETVCKLLTGSNFVVDKYGWVFDLPSPPSNFKVYSSDSEEIRSNVFGKDTCQTLIFYEELKLGSLKLKKESFIDENSMNNPLYSFKGTKYGLYRTKEDAKKDVNRVGVFQIDEKGNSNVIEFLEAKKYFIKELNSGPGFAMDEKIYEANVSGNKLIEITLKDAPQIYCYDIFIQKKQSREFKTEDSVSVEGTEFKVTYYKDILDSNQIGHHKPEKQWILKADKKGVVKLDEDHKVSGDEFYKSSSGKIGIPLGTISIEEVKVPDGFSIQREPIIKHIKSDNSHVEILLHKKYEVINKVIELKVIKQDEYTKKGLEGARFIHIDPNGIEEEYETNEEGIFILSYLKKGTHKIVEKKAPFGYKQNSNCIEFIVDENGTISNLNDNNIKYNLDKDKNVLSIYNNLNLYSVKIQKMNQNKKLLDGAIFGMYFDETCAKLKESSVTNGGYVEFQNLEIGRTYYVKEDKAPHGYQLNKKLLGRKYDFSVRVQLCKDHYEIFINNKLYSREQLEKNNMKWMCDSDYCVLQAVITNDKVTKIPQTGGYMALWMLISLSVMGLYFVRRKKNE